MNDKTNVSADNIAKGKSEQNPNEPKFTQDQTHADVAPPDQKPVVQKEAPKLEAAKGNDEVMSQPPEPVATPAPKIDVQLKKALRETAQEEVHEVMTKREASKLVVKEKPKASPEDPSVKDKID